MYDGAQRLISNVKTDYPRSLAAAVKARDPVKLKMPLQDDAVAGKSASFPKTAPRFVASVALFSNVPSRLLFHLSLSSSPAMLICLG